jgi:hypothetical protein
MNRPWAIVLIAAMLASCRSSQPTTNPFMRTTVPPPATGQGMMVMPGEAAPVVVTPPPGAAPVVVTPGAPVAPAPAPIIAPPVPPPTREFNPPGGNYLYHQSSVGPLKTNGASDALERDLAGSPSTVQNAGYLAPGTPTATKSAQTNLVFRARKNSGESRGDPPEGAASGSRVSQVSVSTTASPAPTTSNPPAGQPASTIATVTPNR